MTITILRPIFIIHLLLVFLSFYALLNFIFVYYVLFYVKWISEYMDFHIAFERLRVMTVLCIVNTVLIFCYIVC